MIVRLASPLAPFTALVLLGCDASGATQGGQALLADPCEATKGGHTWSDLYACYFGPSGKAGCTAQSACHGSFPQQSTQFSGFVCGTSKDAVWYGMTHPIYVFNNSLATCDAGAAALDGSCPDGGDDAGATFCGCYKPAIVNTGGTPDPTTTYLWPSLQTACGCVSGLCNNMPCSESQAVTGVCHPAAGTYTFTADDLARISAWIKEGAQDN